MANDLPNQFDLVVVGTGFPESIVAAAASRVGKSVLHIDTNDFYGGQWASFNLDAYQKFINDCVDKNDVSLTDLQISGNWCNLKSSKQTWHIDEADEDANEDCWTKEKVLKDFRKFNIDITPKLLFSGGKLVELLISSNICRYAEFRAVDQICTMFENQLKNVPCSRTDVFNTKELTIVEKRLLMKLFSNCMALDDNPETLSEYEDRTFLEYLENNPLTPKLKHCILYAISLSNPHTMFADGIKQMKLFILSLGRYGNTPFLFPMYGCGEIPQCFCRLCAVYGGVYCLKKGIDEVRFKDNVLTISVDKKNIKVENLVVGSSSIIAPNVFSSEQIEMENTCGNLSRGIFITSKPIGDDLNPGGGGVVFLRLPASSAESNGAEVIQLSHYSGTCPKGLYLIHITAVSISDNAEEDLAPYTSQILPENDEDSLTVFYSSYFIIPKCNNCTYEYLNTDLAKKINFACGPFFELDYESSIENAKEIFKKIYPDELFLPRAPDPEEIVIGDEDPSAIIEENIPDNMHQHIRDR